MITKGVIKYSFPSQFNKTPLPSAFYRPVMHDLAAQMPDKVEVLEALLAAHNAEQEKSMWPSVLQSPQLIDKPGGVPYEEGDEYIYWPN